MSKTARFSMLVMLVAGSYMVTNVSAGEVVVGEQHHTGAITDFIGKMVKPEGAPQFGAPTGVQHDAPYMGHNEGSQTGAPHGAPLMAPTGAPQGFPQFNGPAGAPHAPHFQPGAPTPCDKGVVPQG